MPPADASAPRAVWWGPTGMNEGWHIRVPFSVTNPLDRDVHNLTASYNLDLRGALIDSGWTTARASTGRQLANFALDERSIRVVEYRSLGTGSGSDGLEVGEVASASRLGLLNLTVPYHNRTAPGVHVEWVLPGVTEAGQTRYFMVYADSLTNGEKAAATYAEREVAPLESRYWVSRGTTLYGVAGSVWVLGLEDGTGFTVEGYQFGRFQPIESGLGPGGRGAIHRDENIEITVSNAPIPIRITSDKPIIAMSTTSGRIGPLTSLRPLAMLNPNVNGFIPSADGSILGTEFSFVAASAGYHVFAPFGPTTVMDDGVQRSTAPARPFIFVPLPGGVEGDGPYLQHKRITSDRPIMIATTPGASGFGQFASSWGAPTGSVMWGFPFAGAVCNTASGVAGNICPGGSGRSAERVTECQVTHLPFNRNPSILVASFEGTAWVRGRNAWSNEVTLPPTTGDLMPLAGQAAPAAPWISPGPTVRPRYCPMQLHATSSATSTDFAYEGRLAAFGGAPGMQRVSAPIGGHRAQEFVAAWDVQVVAVYAGTRVEVRRAGSETTETTLAKGAVLPISATDIRPVMIKTSRPAIVLPTVVGGFFAAIDESPVVRQLGRAEYRGYMPDLEPAGDATEPLVGFAAPGKPVEFRLIAHNKALDHLGRPVPDDLQLSVTPPLDGWRVDLSDESFRLEGSGSKTVTVTVTPPETAKEGARLTVAVALRSAGNPAAVDRVSLVTVVKASYGVDIAFERADGPKTRTFVMDAGESVRSVIVIRNLASVPDSFLVRAAPVSHDWTATLGTAQSATVEVALDAGAHREIPLHVLAPRANASQSFVEITAVSVTSASAASKVTATVRVRADVRVGLDVDNTTVEAAPGETALFRIAFENRGTGGVGVRFNTTGELPEGWERPVVWFGPYVLDEIAGVQPGSTLLLNTTVLVPENATRGERIGFQFFLETLPQFAGDRVVRETIDLQVVVGALHDLVVEDSAKLLPLSAEGTAEAQTTIENQGNGEELLRAVPRSLPPGASLLSGAPTPIERNERGVVRLTIAFANDTPEGTYPILLDVEAADGYAIPWSFDVSVPPRRVATLTPITPTRVIAGLENRLEIELRNDGNVPLDGPPLLEIPLGWTYSWRGGGDGTMLPGGTQLRALDVTPRRDVAPGAYVLRTAPDWATSNELALDLQTVTLEAERVDGGEPGSIIVKVRNRGTGDASDLLVVLEQGGEPLDRIVLKRVAAGGESLAILSAPTRGEAVIKVDADSRFGEAPIEIPLRLGGERPVPVPALLVAAALLGAALASGARRSRY